MTDFKMAWLRAIPLISAATLAATPAAAACFDLANGEPHVLKGTLSSRIAPGPPSFQGVDKGDAPVPIFVLQLSEPICLTGSEYADPRALFFEAQLLPTDQTAKAMRSLDNSSVNVTLADAYGAMTHWQYRPLVASVTAISPAPDIAPLGVAASTVIGFYESLGDGRGDDAAQFVVPERRTGPFSPGEMTRFYGGLVEPLRLLSITPASPHAYLVRYAFKGRAGQCNGRALVTTTTRARYDLISSVKALDGC
ncbi:MAG: hypothetical protein ABSF67_20330 [Roseiarcus sp.]|jgi:hypothetical protein